MGLIETLSTQAGTALYELRCGHLLDGYGLGDATGYTGERGDNHERIIFFADGSSLRQVLDSGMWSVRSSAGRVLMMG